MLYPLPFLSAHFNQTSFQRFQFLMYAAVNQLIAHPGDESPDDGSVYVRIHDYLAPNDFSKPAGNRLVLFITQRKCSRHVSPFDPTVSVEQIIVLFGYVDAQTESSLMDQEKRQVPRQGVDLPRSILQKTFLDIQGESRV